ncbi:MAG TPA: hypothetical protein VJQ55_16260, partial [Candidatus Binatia bacterium]|nr:hypothetical protein [Candidatus Binatia bacterium]
EKLYLGIRGAALAAQRRVITERLLAEMATSTNARAGEFGVLFLPSPAGTDHFRQYVKKTGIRAVDSDLPERSIEGLTFYDGHPNGKMADLIAQSVVKFVKSLEH